MVVFPGQYGDASYTTCVDTTPKIWHRWWVPDFSVGGTYMKLLIVMAMVSAVTLLGCDVNSIRRESPTWTRRSYFS